MQLKIAMESTTCLQIESSLFGPAEGQGRQERTQDRERCPGDPSQPPSPGPLSPSLHRVWGPQKRKQTCSLLPRSWLASRLLTWELGGPKPPRLKIALTSSQAIFRVLSALESAGASGHTPPDQAGRPGILAPVWAPPQAAAKASNGEQSAPGYRAGHGRAVWSQVPKDPL